MDTCELLRIQLRQAVDVIGLTVIITGVTVVAMMFVANWLQARRMRRFVAAELKELLALEGVSLFGSMVMRELHQQQVILTTDQVAQAVAHKVGAVLDQETKDGSSER
jgi:hypothetical protein